MIKPALAHEAYALDTGGLATPPGAWSLPVRLSMRAIPDPEKYPMVLHTRARNDKIDKTGVFTLRHSTRLHHVGVGRAHKGRRVIVLVCDLDIRVLSEDGELLRPHTGPVQGLPTHHRRTLTAYPV
ncbi:MAG: hypothetical protein ACRDYE_00080 [Acidimicrobiales bacterium]